MTTAAETTKAYEAECREFAAQFPTPNTLEAIRHAEAGRLTWEQIHGLFERSLRKALREVQ